MDSSIGKGFRVWCKGTHPTNLNFQTAQWWNCGDYILNKYYNIARMFDGFNDEQLNDSEFFEHFEIKNRE